MLVNFCKMQALGNDFVIIDLITQNVKLNSAQIKRIANRNEGIGCDQVLLIEPPIREDRDFFYRVYNSDGFEVEQCGNGARCVARFFYDAGYVNNSHIKADCLAGPIEFKIEEDFNITVNMGPPNFEFEQIPFTPATPPSSSEISATSKKFPGQIKYEEKYIEFYPLSMGNPHAVVLTPDLDNVSLNKLGSFIAYHEQFPNGTNVEFMQILDRKHVKLRVFERGVGETLSCGSGACAAIVAGIRLGLLDDSVQVQFQSGLGHLTVQWSGNNHSVYMTGPTVAVFVGRFRI